MHTTASLLALFPSPSPSQHSLPLLYWIIHYFSTKPKTLTSHYLKHSLAPAFLASQ